MNDFNLQSKIVFYLNIKNNPEILNFKIVNILRVIEVTELFKLSMSSTERVISILRKVVEGHG